LTKQFICAPKYEGEKKLKMNNDENKIFHKVMVVPDAPDIWMVALCRSGFASQADAMRWALEYMNPQAPTAAIDELYREAINDAFNEEL
jgi:hypothetical protein